MQNFTVLSKNNYAVVRGIANLAARDGRVIMMDRRINVLVVEDSEDDTELLIHALRHHGTRPHYRRVAREHELKAALNDEQWDIVVSDYSMPGFSGLDALHLVRKHDADLPFIVLSGAIGEDIAVEAMRAGANDYIMKGNRARLLPAVEREVREFARRKEQREIRHRLLEREEQIRIAHLIQQGLFPRTPFKTEKFDIGGMSLPAEATGGDYFDFIRLPDNSTAIVVGDVTGHGFGPAMLMAATRAYIRAFCRNMPSAGEILANTNRVLCEDIEDGIRFVTLMLGILDPERCALVYSSAGHHQGYVMDAHGAVKHELSSTGLPLGVDENSDYPDSTEILLETGDLILLLTDGVSETVSAGSGETFGIERALDIVRNNRGLDSTHIVRILHEHVLSFSDGYQEDDITAVVIRVL